MSVSQRRAATASERRRQPPISLASCPGWHIPGLLCLRHETIGYRVQRRMCQSTHVESPCLTYEPHPTPIAFLAPRSNSSMGRCQQVLCHRSWHGWSQEPVRGNHRHDHGRTTLRGAHARPCRSSARLGPSSVRRGQWRWEWRLGAMARLVPESRPQGSAITCHREDEETFNFSVKYEKKYSKYNRKYYRTDVVLAVPRVLVRHETHPSSSCISLSLLTRPSLGRVEARWHHCCTD